MVEVDVDTMAYDQGHIPGAIGWNWTTQLNDTVTRDILSKAQVQCLMGESGIGRGTTVVLYGDNNNWFATYAFWQLRMYGHQRLKVMNGGRQKWIDEGRPTSTDVRRRSRRHTALRTRTRASGRPAATCWRSLRPRTTWGSWTCGRPTSSPASCWPRPTCPRRAPARRPHPRRVQRPWLSAVNESDGTFKSADELSEIYGKAVKPDREVIAYCRIGERSSHTWFVLSQILGYDKVRNYDGSWTEYGSIIGAPIEK